MANTSSLSKVGMSTDLKKRLMFLIGALFVFRIGAHVPVPGVDPVALHNLFANINSGLLGMLNVFSGGSLSRFSVFAIGIMPYISASIIMQLAAEIYPPLKALKKEGIAGQRTITKYTRLGTVVLAALQSFGSAVFLYRHPGLVVIPQYEFYLSTVVCLTTGTMFLMWVGEQITERGIGNGISLIICAGIAAGIPGGIGKLFTLTGEGAISPFLAIVIIVAALALVYVVVFIESAQRKVPIHYAKRQVGNRIMQGQNTYFPFKLNMSGVIPPIFASSIILFPTTLLSWFGSSADSQSWIGKLVLYFQHGKPLYMIFFAVAVIFFCYFYTALVFSPREIADNLKKNGAFVPGIRPGQQTTKYIEKVVLRLTFYGALYITIVCLIPEFMIQAVHVPFYLGGTSLLILVVVIMDFSVQWGSYQMSQQYESIMNKSAVLNNRKS